MSLFRVRSSLLFILSSSILLSPNYLLSFLHPSWVSSTSQTRFPSIKALPLLIGYCLHQFSIIKALPLLIGYCLHNSPSSRLIRPQAYSVAMNFSTVQNVAHSYQNWMRGAQIYNAPDHLYHYTSPIRSSFSNLLPDPIAAAANVPYQSPFQDPTMNRLSSDSYTPDVYQPDRVVSKRVETRSGSLVCYDYTGGLNLRALNTNNVGQPPTSDFQRKPHGGKWELSNGKWYCDSSSTRTIIEECSLRPKPDGK